jgi:hypothetical protein
MENTNTVSIPLVDILSELLGKRIVMSGEDYVFFESLEKVSQDKIDEAVVLKEQKEIELIHNKFRKERDDLLSTVVDHYQKPLVWETLTTEQQDKVRVYRQALLDSTTNWILPEELVL